MHIGREDTLSNELFSQPLDIGKITAVRKINAHTKILWSRSYNFN